MKSLLKRSDINSIPNQVIARNLNTSICRFEKQNESSNSNQSKENKPAEDSDKQSQKNDDDKRKTEKKKKKINEEDRQNNFNKAMEYGTKAVLWFALFYSIAFTIVVILTLLKGERVNGGVSENYMISWKEFVQYMLASGEVKEIIVRPQYDYVRIVLYDGAIVNGRRPRFTNYMLSVSNIEHFEQRVREVEKSMGISEGISIRYERFSEIYAKLFAGIVVCAVLFAILKRMKVGVPPGANSPVSVIINIYAMLMNS